MQSITLKVVILMLTSLLFHKGIPALKGKKITSLVGVSCMRKRRIEAFVKSFEEEEKGLIQTRCSEN
jgi:uncharacterized protein YdaU (DUF1376 family)